MTPVIAEKAFEDAIECALVLDFTDPCLRGRLLFTEEDLDRIREFLEAARALSAQGVSVTIVPVDRLAKDDLETVGA